MSWDPEPGALGRRVEHDERSREPAFRAFAAPRLLDHPVLWPRVSRPWDQGDVGACTGFAAVGLLATQPLHRPPEGWRAKYAYNAYSLATVLDGFSGRWLPSDTGSSGLAVCKALKQFGWISSYRHVFGIEHMRAAIAVGPVMVGTNWYSSFMRPSGTDGRVTISAGASVEGGHQWEVVGYDPDLDLWRACNSWSPLWGDHGYFTVPGSVMARLLDEDGDCQQVVR